MKEEILKKEIMSRVRTVHFARRYFQPVYLELVALICLFVGVASFVSVGDVLKNFWNVPLSSVHTFLATAFMNTDLFVQMIVSAAVVVCAFFIRDIIRYRNLFFVNNRV